MPSLFRKKSTKSVAPQPDASTLQVYQSKAQLYDELVAYLQKGAAQLSSCTDASSADQASHEWHYLATSSSAANLASLAEEGTAHASSTSPVLSSLADLASILELALTAKADWHTVKARQVATAQELDLARTELTTAREELQTVSTELQATRAELAATRAEVEAVRGQADHVRAALSAAWELVEQKAHALVELSHAHAQSQRDACELKQRVAFLDAVVASPLGTADAAAGDSVVPRATVFKVVVSDETDETKTQVEADGKRGLVPADSTATMVDEEEADTDRSQDERGRECDDTRSLGVQTPTPAMMKRKMAVFATEEIAGNGKLGRVADDDDDNLEVALLVPLL